MVYVDVQGSGEPYFVAHPDFLSWYERCLNELLAGWDTAALGYGHPGTVAELKHIIANTTDASLRARGSPVASARAQISVGNGRRQLSHEASDEIGIEGGWESA